MIMKLFTFDLFPHPTVHHVFGPSSPPSTRGHLKSKVLESNPDSVLNSDHGEEFTVRVTEEGTPRIIRTDPPR